MRSRNALHSRSDFACDAPLSSLRIRFVVFFTFLILVSLLATGAWAQTLSGVVRDASTFEGLGGIDLDAYDAVTGASISLQGGRTAEDGSFEVTLPTGGQYVLRADPTASQGYGATYFGGTAIRSMASPLVVEEGGELEGLSIFLPRGVTIRGRVENAAGVGLGQIDLDVFSASGDFLSAYPGRTDSLGDFSIGALPPGEYLLRADPSLALGQFYVRAYFGDVLNEAEATPISVSTSALEGLTITLEEGGALSGEVTAEDHFGPQANVDLDLFDASGARMTIGGRTDATGQFEVGVLPAGQYRLRVDPAFESGYARKFYGQSPTVLEGALITVSAGQITTGLDVSIVRGGVVSGTIRDVGGQPLAGVDLDVFDATGSRITLYDADTTPTGDYLLGPLPPGAYTLRADPMAATGLAERFNGDTDALGLATPLLVEAGGVHAGVDFTLQTAGTIAGVVSDGEGSPIAGIDLDLWEATTRTRLRASATTAVDGSYVVEGLNPGEYLVRADPAEASGLVRTYYPAEISIDFAQSVFVSSGSATNAVDLQLRPGATLSGAVTRPDGLPAEGIDIDVFVAATGGRLEQTALTDAMGRFVLSGIPAGEFLVRADPEEISGFAPLYNGAAIDEDFATPISLEEGEIRTSIDFALNLAGTIAGVIRSADGTPIPEIDLDVWHADSMTRLGISAETDENGSYRLTGLNPGSYVLRADPTEVQGYAQTYYSNGISLMSSEPVQVSGGSTVGSIDFMLNEAASIAGYVNGPDGHPAIGVDIDIFSADGMEKLAQNAATDGNGYFSLHGLPAGTYLIRAQPSPGSGSISTAIGGVRRVADATPLTVAAGQDAVAPSIALIAAAAQAPAVPSMGMHGYGVLALLLVLMARASRNSPLARATST